MTKERDLMTMFCDMIVKNKSIGIYDGAYKCVELATGKKPGSLPHSRRYDHL